jgi:cell division protease FtsH
MGERFRSLRRPALLTWRQTRSPRRILIAAPSEAGPFRAQFAELVADLLAESQEEPDDPLATAIEAHLGANPTELRVHAEDLPGFELANLQVGVDAALAREGYSHRLIGLSGQGLGLRDVGLGDISMGRSHLKPGPPQYMNASIGPRETLPCLTWSLLLIESPGGPLCLFVRRGQENGPSPGLSVHAMAKEEQTATSFLADLRRLMREHDVFRGKVLTLETTRFGSHRVIFLERAEMNAEDLVLPEGVLDRIQRHVVEPTHHRDALLSAGRHLSRGLLLWGPPGTGKTHCVRYLTAKRQDATVIILSGASLGLVGAFGALARRLAPSLVILEDVDLVAEERSNQTGSRQTLFELMNEMSGLGEDADITFILTTNRPELLEPALAARPGRVDLAVEIPLPNAQARRELLELYASDVDLGNLDEVFARTAGATASFFKELARKATMRALENGRREAESADFNAALDELLSETSTLTRVLLGHSDFPDGQASAPSRAWLERIARAEPHD